MPKNHTYLNDTTPHAEEMKKKSTEEILAEAKAFEPPRERRPEDLLEVIDTLKDKGMSWFAIKGWMMNNTEFQRSETFWKKRWEPWRAKKVQALQPQVVPTISLLAAATGNTIQ